MVHPGDVPTQIARLLVAVALPATAFLLGLLILDTLTGSRVKERLSGSSLGPHVQRFPSPLTATLALLGVVVFSVFGSTLLGTPRRSLDLDRERNLATAYSVALMLGACLTAQLLAAWSGREQMRLRAASLVLAVVLLAMAADDWLSWHERLEGVGGWTWTQLYAPVPGLGMVAGAVIGIHGARRARTYLLTGFLAWVGAAVLETFFWGSGEREQQPVSMAIEETLEMLAPIALAAGLGAVLLACIAASSASHGTSREPGSP